MHRSKLYLRAYLNSFCIPKWYNLLKSLLPLRFFFSIWVLYLSCNRQLQVSAEWVNLQPSEEWNYLIIKITTYYEIVYLFLPLKSLPQYENNCNILYFLLIQHWACLGCVNNLVNPFYKTSSFSQISIISLILNHFLLLILLYYNGNPSKNLTWMIFKRQGTAWYLNVNPLSPRVISN